MLGDIESDLSRFHQIRDMWALPADLFFRLARRLPAYGGAVAAALISDRTEGLEGRMTQATPPRTQSAPSGARVVGATQAELRTSDIGGLFSFGHSHG